METTTTNKNTGTLSKEKIDEIFAEHERRTRKKK